MNDLLFWVCIAVGFIVTPIALYLLGREVERRANWRWLAEERRLARERDNRRGVEIAVAKLHGYCNGRRALARDYERHVVSVNPTVIVLPMGRKRG